MSDNYCDICDNIVKRNIKKKQPNSKSHNLLYSSVVHRYSVKKIRKGEVEKTLRIYIADHRKKFVFFNITVKWKVRKSDNSEKTVKKRITDKVNQFLLGDYSVVRFYHIECGSKDLDRFLLSEI